MASTSSSIARDNFSEYHVRREKLIRELREGSPSQNIGLNKATSNLFRARKEDSKRRIDVREFNHVLSVDADSLVADVEGMTTYEDLVDATLKHHLLPTVVPELKTITIGGALSGLGIESSSFKYGLVHETIEEIEVLLADGSTVTCSRTHNSDLTHGLPNSYGTLGYALKVKVKLIPAKRYVRLIHRCYSDITKLFAELGSTCADPHFDYVDGVVFSRGEAYITTGEFTDSAPYTSDYTYTKVYYRSIRKRELDYLTAKDYIWRWDTDWFWCSKVFHVQNPLVRAILGRDLLNSRTYQRIMRMSRKLPFKPNTEPVIQDADIPIEHAAEFLDFLLREIGIVPIWLCPFKTYDPTARYTLCPIDTSKLYVNFGFWDMLPKAGSEGFYNRKIERMALHLRGVKGLYSNSYYDEEMFWSIYDRESYFALKRKYDPNDRFRDLYQKTALKM
jgi:FAD/FMN-containing dehydrogenase